MSSVSPTALPKERSEVTKSPASKIEYSFKINQIQTIALPAIAAFAGVYFGYEFWIARQVVDFALCTTLSLGGIQEIFIQLALLNKDEKTNGYRALALAFGVFSMLTSACFFLSFVTSFQAIKILASAAHFFLTCRAMMPANMNQQSQRIPFHSHPRLASAGVGPKKSHNPVGFQDISKTLIEAERKLPDKITYIPTHPRGFCNVDGNSCFFNAIIKVLLSSPQFRSKLDDPLDPTKSTIPLSIRQHIKERLIILRDEFVKAEPDAEKVSQAWYELRFENELIKTRFKPYIQHDSQEVYVFLEEVLDLNLGHSYSLQECVGIKIDGQAERIVDQRNPVSMYKTNLIQGKRPVFTFSLAKDLKTKLDKTGLKKRPEESGQEYEFRLDLFNAIKQRSFKLQELIDFSYIKLGEGEKAPEEQLKDLLDLEADDHVSVTRQEVVGALDCSIQQQIQKALDIEHVTDYKDESITPPKICGCKRRVFFSHPDVSSFQSYSFMLPRFDPEKLYDKITFQITDIENEIVIPVFDQKTQLEKNVRLRLKGITCHRGINRIGGHYYSYIREADGWYKHDDADVTKIDDGKLQREFFPYQPYSDPYLMFYEVVPEPIEAEAGDE